MTATSQKVTIGVDGITLAEGTCLGLIASGHRHGWALVRDLSPSGDLGRVWSLSRALTYRAIDRLIALDLVSRSGNEPGAGPERTLLATTPAGRRVVKKWVRTPVRHLRDVRTEFLVKLTLAERLGVDRREMIDAQLEALTPIIEAVSTTDTDTDTGTDPSNDALHLWRLESSRAVQRFLERARSDLH